MKLNAEITKVRVIHLLAAVVVSMIVSCTSPRPLEKEQGIKPAAAGRQSRNLVEAGTFQVSGNGKKAGQFGYPGYIEFYDSKGNTTGQLFGVPNFDDEPSLSLYGANGARVRISVLKAGDGPQVFLSGANGKPRAWFFGTGNGSELKLADDLGKPHLRLVSDRSGGRIEFIDDNGKVVKTITSTSK